MARGCLCRDEAPKERSRAGRATPHHSIRRASPATPSGSRAIRPDARALPGAPSAILRRRSPGASAPGSPKAHTRPVTGCHTETPGPNPLHFARLRWQRRRRMMTPLRNCRLAVGLSQSEFAARLGASVETYRTWDSGRRPTPAPVLERARQWSQSAAGNQLLSLPRLAALLIVHVRTLRLAARDGRLDVFYGNRTLFGHPIPLATLKPGSTFMLWYCNQTTRCSPRPPAPKRTPTVPDDFDSLLRAFRRGLGITQSELARSLGAASKAVVYQWESRRRRPSPQFWGRLMELQEQRSESRPRTSASI